MKKFLMVLVACLVILVVPTLASTGNCTPGSTDSQCALRAEVKKEIETLKTGYKQAVSAVKNTITGNKDKIKTNRKAFEDNFESVNSYLQKPLTGANKQTVQSLIKQKQSTMTLLQQQTKQAIQSGTVDWTGYIQSGTQIIQAFQTAILPYIASGKLDLFSAFIQQRLQLLQANTTIKVKISDAKKEIKDAAETMKQQIEQKKKDLEAQIEQKKKDMEAQREQKKKEVEAQKEQKKRGNSGSGQHK
ncbi:MAG: hypothetical protein WCJ39_02005 [bacterium]